MNTGIRLANSINDDRRRDADARRRNLEALATDRPGLLVLAAHRLGAVGRNVLPATAGRLSGASGGSPR